jgi:hypothetical protein
MHFDMKAESVETLIRLIREEFQIWALARQPAGQGEE